MNYVINENKNLVNIDIQELAFNAAHPIGEIYVQYPGKKDPQTLYGRGTWTNKSSEFAGLFFRAEGGNAGPFNNDSVVTQEDKIREIKGLAYWILAGGSENDTRSGVFTGSNKTGNRPLARGDIGSGTWNISFNANLGTPSDNPMAGHADGPEIRPVNTTIRIWERTA